MRSTLSHPLRVAPIVAWIVLIAAPALAQGTSAEREACTEDAVNLCSDTIPDVPKTTACMKAHLSQLSPRCRAIVAGPDEVRRPERARRVEREARPVEREAPPIEREAPPSRDDAEETGGRRYLYEAPGDEDLGGRRYIYTAPDGQPAEAPELSDRTRARARARIGHLCDDDQIDPETCALTERALR